MGQRVFWKMTQKFEAHLSDHPIIAFHNAYFVVSELIGNLYYKGFRNVVLLGTFYKTWHCVDQILGINETRKQLDHVWLHCLLWESMESLYWDIIYWSLISWTGLLLLVTRFCRKLTTLWVENHFLFKQAPPPTSTHTHANTDTPKWWI